MKHKASFLMIAVIFALVSGACSLTRVLSAQPTPLFPTLTVAPSLPAASPAATQAAAASATQAQAAQPTQPQAQPTTGAPVTGNASPTPPPTVVGVPVNTGVPPTRVPPTSVPPTSAPPSNTTTTVNIFLIAMNDNGASLAMPGPCLRHPSVSDCHPAFIISVLSVFSVAKGFLHCAPIITDLSDKPCHW